MKFISLISSGIDSPVASYLVSNNAKEIIFLHSNIEPFTDNKEVDNFISIAKHLKNIIPCNVKTYLINHGPALNVYQENCNIKYTCVFCKRMLLRYAKKLSEKEQAKAVIMGDSLGQVASQTLQNMKVIDNAIDLPILRPLIGFDKEDIIKIAKEIGTYELSILPNIGCKAVPKKPSTNAKFEKILSEEKKIDVDDLTKNAALKLVLL